MTMTRSRLVALIGAFLYVSAMAIGVAAERIRFDRQRAAVLQRHDEAVQQWHRFLMAAEQRKAEARPAGGNGHAVQVVW